LSEIEGTQGRIALSIGFNYSVDYDHDYDDPRLNQGLFFSESETKMITSLWVLEAWQQNKPGANLG
jgi:hypothetical protein